MELDGLLAGKDELDKIISLQVKQDAMRRKGGTFPLASAKREALAERMRRQCANRKNVKA
jgi:hypothetical protein